MTPHKEAWSHVVGCVACSSVTGVDFLVISVFCHAAVFAIGLTVGGEAIGKKPVADFQGGMGGHLPGPTEKLSIKTAA
jgi:hypothetical protein